MIVSPGSSSVAVCWRTLSVTVPAGSMSQTARGGSSAVTSSSSEPAPTPPSATSAATGPGLWLCPATRWPPRRRRRAMFAPIRPSPTIPSSSGVSVATPSPFREHPGRGTRLRVSSADYAARMAHMSDMADALVVFGITGDLARRMTLPALYRLTEQGHLSCTVLAVGRRELSREEFEELIHDAVTDTVDDVEKGE